MSWRSKGVMTEIENEATTNDDAMDVDDELSDEALDRDSNSKLTAFSLTQFR